MLVPAQYQVQSSSQLCLQAARKGEEAFAQQKKTVNQLSRRCLQTIPPIKGLIYKIYKQLNNKITNKPIQK